MWRSLYSGVEEQGYKISISLKRHLYLWMIALRTEVAASRPISSVELTEKSILVLVAQ